MTTGQPSDVEVATDVDPRDLVDTWYLIASLRCISVLVRQGVSDEALLQAWRAYQDGAPTDLAPQLDQPEAQAIVSPTAASKGIADDWNGWV